MDKTKEMVFYFRRVGKHQYNLPQTGSAAEEVSNMKFLFVHLADYLTLKTNTIQLFSSASFTGATFKAFSQTTSLMEL